MKDINEQIENEVSKKEVGAYSFVAEKLAELESTYGAEVPDASTKEGYERSKSITTEMRELRGKLEAKRKEIKSPALAYGKLIDSSAKELKERIEAIEEPHKAAYREVDAEKKRLKEEAEQRLLDIRALPETCFDKTPEQIEEMIDDLAMVSIDFDTFRHKLDDAQNWMPSVLNQLSVEHNKAIERKLEAERIEAERAELEELRRLKAEQEERDRLEREAKEREENEKRIAEQARIEAEQRAEREKQEAIEAAERAEREKQELAEKAERDRIEAEEKAKREAEEAARRAEEEKRAAIEAEQERQRQEKLAEEAAEKAREEDRAHRAKINNEALQAFVDDGFSEEQAKQIVKLIASRSVPHVGISY